MKGLTSIVTGFEGVCQPIWLNQNTIDNRIDCGVTGYFKLIKPHWFFGHTTYGEEFHGIIKRKGIVESTEIPVCKECEWNKPIRGSDICRWCIPSNI